MRSRDFNKKTCSWGFQITKGRLEWLNDPLQGVSLLTTAILMRVQLLTKVIWCNWKLR